MSHTYSKILLHVVFSTKDRRPWIDDAWSDRLYKFISGALEGESAHLIRGGGIADHAHLLMEVKQTHAPADLMRAIKTNSSKFIHDEGLCRDFSWQTGYGIFSVSRSQQPTLIDYINGQAEHHRRRTFQEELLALLELHEIDYDPRYLWD